MRSLLTGAAIASMTAVAAVSGCATGGDEGGVPTFDGSRPFDAGPRADAGRPRDSGFRPDAVAPRDAGAARDSGFRPTDSGIRPRDSGFIPGLDAGGLFCTSSADCASMPGTCCLEFGGPGFCVPGMEMFGVCIPSG